MSDKPIEAVIKITDSGIEIKELYNTLPENFNGAEKPAEYPFTTGVQ